VDEERQPIHLFDGVLRRPATRQGKSLTDRVVLQRGGSDGAGGGGTVCRFGGMRPAGTTPGSRFATRGQQIGLGVGSAQGFATMGWIGFEGRYDYGTIGTVVNLAARFYAEAKDGQIVLGRRVATAVAELVRLTPVGELSLTGLTRPVAACAPSARVDSLRSLLTSRLVRIAKHSDHRPVHAHPCRAMQLASLFSPWHP
jgi:hypothetical protein